MRIGMLASILGASGTVLTLMASVSLDQATSNLASYLPGWAPAWFATSQADMAVSWLGYLMVSGALGLIGGQIAAKKHMTEADRPRRLSHTQKQRIVDAFKGVLTVESQLIIIPYRNDECNDLSEDIASAFRMTGAKVAFDDIIGGIDLSERDVGVYPLEGYAHHAETMASLLNDFGIKAKVGAPLAAKLNQQLFRLVVNRPS